MWAMVIGLIAGNAAVQAVSMIAGKIPVVVMIPKKSLLLAIFVREKVGYG